MEKSCLECQWCGSVLNPRCSNPTRKAAGYGNADCACEHYSARNDAEVDKIVTSGEEPWGTWRMCVQGAFHISAPDGCEYTPIPDCFDFGDDWETIYDSRTSKLEW